MRSLLEYGRWIGWHHPDPVLVDRVYAAGGELARSIAADTDRMRAQHRHIVEVDSGPPDVTVLSTLTDVVSFRVGEHLAHRELVDATGRVIEHKGPGREQYLVSILRFAPDRPWRLSDVEQLGPPIEVQL